VKARSEAETTESGTDGVAVASKANTRNEADIMGTGLPQRVRLTAPPDPIASRRFVIWGPPLVEAQQNRQPDRSPWSQNTFATGTHTVCQNGFVPGGFAVTMSLIVGCTMKAKGSSYLRTIPVVVRAAARNCRTGCLLPLARGGRLRLPAILHDPRCSGSRIDTPSRAY
jgi:hypothetical protein